MGFWATGVTLVPVPQPVTPVSCELMMGES